MRSPGPQLIRTTMRECSTRKTRRKGSHRKRKQRDESVAETLHEKVGMTMNKVHSQISKDSSGRKKKLGKMSGGVWINKHD